LQAVTNESHLNLKKLIAEHKLKVSIESEVQEHHNKSLKNLFEEYSSKSKTNASSVEAENRRMREEVREIKKEYQELLCENC
jgi:hypothetical protein